MRRCILLVIIAVAYCVPWTASAQEKKVVDLFNGKDLTGWESFLVDDGVKMEDVWSVKDGILICKGEPMGYLATKKKFKNFKLVVVWRWPPGKKPGNSGVLLRITENKLPLPKCMEAQLKSGNAGDIWAFNGCHVKTDSNRFREASSPKIGDFVGVSKESGNEKEPGEWNEYEITFKGDHLILEVNQKKVNECTGCDVVAGQIGLQSEGGEIHFKTVKLLPLDD
jgi:hypothetical protein